MGLFHLELSRDTSHYTGHSIFHIEFDHLEMQELKLFFFADNTNELFCYRGTRFYIPPGLQCMMAQHKTTTLNMPILGHNCTLLLAKLCSHRDSQNLKALIKNMKKKNCAAERANLVLLLKKRTSGFESVFKKFVV